MMFALLAGCGDGREPPAIVKGRVTNQGRTVTGAVVYFEKEGSEYSLFMPLDPEGRFQVKTYDYGGLPSGAYRISIKPMPDKLVALVGDEKKGLSHPLIPNRFWKNSTSGLRVEVKSGENPPLEIDLGGK